MKDNIWNNPDDITPVTDDSFIDSILRKKENVMNDRFLCRGQREDDKQWVHGFLIDASDPNTGIYEQETLQGKTVIVSINNGCAYPIGFDTVGQCTGLTDKNGKLIFEGDILQDFSGLYRLAQVVWHEKNLAWGVFTLGERNYPLCAENNCEIIGNIHDNPELLGGNE